MKLENKIQNLVKAHSLTTILMDILISNDWQKVMLEFSNACMIHSSNEESLSNTRTATLWRERAEIFHAAYAKVKD